MFAAATIPYDPEEQDFTLEDLREHLAANLPYECTLTWWEGFSGSVPEVRVATAVPLTIQIADDPGHVPEELAGLADEAEGVLSGDWVQLLRRCTARLDVMEAEEEIQLDPTQPDVEAVLVEIARFVDGLVHDNVNGEWLVPEG
ncbi:MAG TPA: hypothetical protein VFR03_06525 [Thermoanaerobaculia bacterium]|nr:hypothetical protein [Thermoanaerobaculia bacterium]HEU4752860.1 hypothetical protein [Armatimonadota bacterium]